MAYQRTRWNKIYNEQLARLQTGELAPGMRLPSLLELAELWGVSYLTAQKIVRQLADNGYLKIIHGRGIFVCDNSSRSENNVPRQDMRIGFLGYSTGEVFADIYRGLQQNLPESCRTVLLTTPQEYSNYNVREFEEMYQNIIRCNYDSLVLQGDYNLNYRALNKYHDKFKQLIFNFYFNGKYDIPNANYVTFDYYNGGYLAAKHLLEQGFENIVFLTYEDISQFKMLQRDLAGMPGHDLLGGIIAACDDAGIDFFAQGGVIYKNQISSFSNQEHQRKLAKLMQTRRTGFIGVNDVRAWAVYQAAANNKMTMGEDVAMVGFLNLPQFRNNIFPALSSVAFDELASGKKIAELILGNARNERVIIPPQLIVRGSSSTADDGDNLELNHFNLYNQ